MITSSKDDTLETILEKIQSQKESKGRIGVYTLFRMTRPQDVNKINIYIQVKDPVLWEEIRKKFYPNFIDKIKGWFS